MNLSTFFPLGWKREQTRWRNLYDGLLEGRLAWAVEFASRASPQDLRPRLPSLLTLLEEAYRRKVDPFQTAALIAALHPWPLRWGYWAVWEAHMRHVLSATSLPPTQKALFWTHLGYILEATGRHAESEDAFSRAFSLAAETGDSVTLAQAGYRWVGVLLAMERFEDAVEQLHAVERAVRSAQVSLPPDERLQASAYLALAADPILRRKGEIQPALERIEGVIRGLQAAADRIHFPLLAELFVRAGALAWEQEDFPASEANLRQALAYYRRLEDRFAEAEILGDLGLVYWSMFALDEAETSLRQSLRISEELNARGRMAVDVGNLALVYLTRGNLPLAETYLLRQRALARQSGLQHETWRAECNLAMVYFSQGDYEGAIPGMEQQRAQERANGMLRSWAVSSLFLGVAYVMTGRTSCGLNLLQETLDVARRLDSEILLGLGLRAQSLVLPLQDARFFLQRALDIARRYERPFDEAACLLWQAKYNEDERTRRALWQQGSDILRRLRAEFWLEGHSPENPPILPFLR